MRPDDRCARHPSARESTGLARLSPTGKRIQIRVLPCLRRRVKPAKPNEREAQVCSCPISPLKPKTSPVWLEDILLQVIATNDRKRSHHLATPTSYRSTPSNIEYQVNHSPAKRVKRAICALHGRPLWQNQRAETHCIPHAIPRAYSWMRRPALVVNQTERQPRKTLARRSKGTTATVSCGSAPGVKSGNPHPTLRRRGVWPARDRAGSCAGRRSGCRRERRAPKARGGLVRCRRSRSGSARSPTAPRPSLRFESSW